MTDSYYEMLDQQRPEVADAIEKICDQAGTCCADHAVLIAAGEMVSALARQLSEAPDARTNARLHGCAFEGWQCFHCGEVFTTVGGAADHFGADPTKKPGCMIRVQLGDERGLLMDLRKAEARIAELERQLSDAQVPEHDTLSARDVKTLRRWSRDVERMAQTFNDDRACMCRAAGELLMAITVTRAALPAQPQERGAPGSAIERLRVRLKGMTENGLKAFHVDVDANDAEEQAEAALHVLDVIESGTGRPLVFNDSKRKAADQSAPAAGESGKPTYATGTAGCPRCRYTPCQCATLDQRPAQPQEQSK